MKRLLNFFKSPIYWRKNCMAVDKNGVELNLNCFTQDSQVYAMSLQGAIAYLFSFEKEPEKRYSVMNKISKAIVVYTKKNLFIAEFNNRPETTFQDIVNVLKIADSKNIDKVISGEKNLY
jgi:hypothetical protein